MYKSQFFSAATLVTLDNFPKNAESMAKSNHISFYLMKVWSCKKYLSLKIEKKHMLRSTKLRLCIGAPVICLGFFSVGFEGTQNLPSPRCRVSRGCPASSGDG